MTHRGYDFNEYGTMVSRHTCDVCGETFTFCPAIHSDDTCGRPPELAGPDDPGCASYDVSRDVDKMLRDGVEILASPRPGADPWVVS